MGGRRRRKECPPPPPPPHTRHGLSVFSHGCNGCERLFFFAGKPAHDLYYSDGTHGTATKLNQQQAYALRSTFRQPTHSNQHRFFLFSCRKPPYMMNLMRAARRSALTNHVGIYLVGRVFRRETRRCVWCLVNPRVGVFG
jgi:hypothetical protein